jgi:hypothetical protein
VNDNCQTFHTIGSLTDTPSFPIHVLSEQSVGTLVGHTPSHLESERVKSRPGTVTTMWLSALVHHLAHSIANQHI